LDLKDLRNVKNLFHQKTDKKFLNKNLKRQTLEHFLRKMRTTGRWNALQEAVGAGRFELRITLSKMTIRPRFPEAFPVDIPRKCTGSRGMQKYICLRPLVQKCYEFECINMKI